MKLLCDEGVERQVVERLRADGHTVEYVAEGLSFASDDQVLDHALSQEAVLVTTDRDFGELVFRQQRATGGVLLFRRRTLRLRPLPAAADLTTSATVLSNFLSSSQAAIGLPHAWRFRCFSLC